MSLGEAVKSYTTLSRFEFLPAVAVAILIGIFLGAESFQKLLELDTIIFVIEGLVIFFLLFNAGFQVNCWADWEVDKVYKTRLYETVMRLGRKNLGRMVAVHIALALILSIHLAYALGKIEILLLVIVGTFVGIGYSVEPLRFKRRGSLHMLMAFPVFFIPGTFSYLLVHTLPLTEPSTYFFLLIAIGITLAHYGLVLISQTEDFPEDKASGIETPAVSWGLRKTISIAFYLNLIGSAMIIAGFALWFSFYAYLLFYLPLLIAGRLIPLRDVYALHEKGKSLEEEKILEEIRKEMPKYPKWHGIGLAVIMLAGFLMLIFRSLG